MKKGLFTIFPIFNIFLFPLNAGPIDKLLNASPEECIQYTLEKNKENTTVTIQITDNACEYHVYGEEGKEIDSKSRMNDVYEIGSLTVTFTALLVAKAQKDGLLDITQSIDKYLNLQEPGQTENKYYPTIKEILTHFAGYEPYYLNKKISKYSKHNDFTGFSKEQVLQQIKKINLKKDKKYGFEYSNFGYAVLGLILESVYKKDFVTLMNDFVQKDLGMVNTRIADGKGNLNNYWEWSHNDGYLSAGALISTPEDMIIYAKLHLEEKGYFKEAHLLFSDTNVSNFFLTKLGISMEKIGYAWFLDEKNGYMWHSGASGNYNCYMAFSPEKNSAVIVLSDLPSDFKIPATIVGIKMISSK